MESAPTSFQTDQTLQDWFKRGTSQLQSISETSKTKKYIIYGLTFLVVIKIALVLLFPQPQPQPRIDDFSCENGACTLSNEGFDPNGIAPMKSGENEQKITL
jgi:hypothetical protein